MIDIDVDYPLEELLAFYKRAGVSLPALGVNYNNSMGFKARKIYKKNVRRNITPRSGTTKFVTSGRVISVQKATFTRNFERIETLVGGRVVPSARDPFFMERLEFGGSIPKDNFGNVGLPGLPTRSGNKSRAIPKRWTLPRLAAQAISTQNLPGSKKRRWAIALAMSIKQKKPFIRMPDRKGRQAIYRVKGKGRGKKRKASTVTKFWTLSRGSHKTPATHALRRARETAMIGRVKTFKKAAQRHYDRITKRG